MAILTITYEFGSGGGEIGRAVSRDLGYEYISLRSIREAAKALGKNWELFSEEYEGGAHNIWQRYDWSFMGFMALSQSVILEHALKNNVVLMTRGANYLLQDIPHALRVRISCPREMRIERIAKQQAVTLKAAKDLVKQADWEVANVIHQLYGKKWDDPESYDIRFDTSTQKFEEIVEILKSMLAAKDKLTSMRLLELKAHAARIKATIATNPAFLIPTLEVEPVEDHIVVRGVARSIKEHEAIDREIRGVPGNASVICDIDYRGAAGKSHKIK